MHRWLTPLRHSLIGRAFGVAGALRLSGTATVLCLLGWTRPGVLTAQAVGTMQVLANVTRADAAWAGLSGAQEIVRQLALRPGTTAASRADLALSRVELRFSATGPNGASARTTVLIQYLRN